MNPRCPNCKHRIAYAEAAEVHANDGTMIGQQCPHCQTRIVWSVTLGTLGARGFKQSRAAPYWSKGR